jgi:hypothetical protein
VRVRAPWTSTVGDASAMICGTMPEVIAALDAFVQEHRRCGELDGGGGGDVVWMSCDCGAEVVRSVIDGG